MDLGGLKEACIRWGPDAPCKGAIITGKNMLGHAQQHFSMSCAKMAEPINLLFALWTRMGRRKHKFSRVCQIAPMCPCGWAHWRHVANTI